jgi:hypothetical protein
VSTAGIDFIIWFSWVAAWRSKGLRRMRKRVSTSGSGFNFHKKRHDKVPLTFT